MNEMLHDYKHSQEKKAKIKNAYDALKEDIDRKEKSWVDTLTEMKQKLESCDADYKHHKKEWQEI